MENLLKRITKYDIFVCYIPGCFFIFISKKIFGLDLLMNNIIIDLGLIYFYGILSKYIGRIFREVLKYLKFLDYIEYGEYINESYDDTSINIIRNISSLETFIGVTILIIIEHKLFRCESNYCKDILLFVYVFIFVIILIFNIKCNLDMLKKRRTKHNKSKKV